MKLADENKELNSVLHQLQVDDVAARKGNTASEAYRTKSLNLQQEQLTELHKIEGYLKFIVTIIAIELAAGVLYALFYLFNLLLS